MNLVSWVLWLVLVDRTQCHELSPLGTWLGLAWLLASVSKGLSHQCGSWQTNMHEGFDVGNDAEGVQRVDDGDGRWSQH